VEVFNSLARMPLAAATASGTSWRRLAAHVSTDVPVGDLLAELDSTLDELRQLRQAARLDAAERESARWTAEADLVVARDDARRRLAATKLVSVLGATGSGLAARLRLAWEAWLAACAALAGDMARDEAEILRNELSAELQSNAALQQRVTSLELAAAETAKLLPSQAAVEAGEAERLRTEREVRSHGSTPRARRLPRPRPNTTACLAERRVLRRRRCGALLTVRSCARVSAPPAARGAPPRGSGAWRGGRRG
jgi:multidrug efflux pump subunit AcrA (membrane-fusion protein)